MDIKDFVKNVIVDLTQAISEANSTTERNFNFRGVSSERTALEFDIAVTVENSKSKDIEGRIKVLSFAQGGIGFLSRERNSTVSRVRFGIDESGK